MRKPVLVFGLLIASSLTLPASNPGPDWQMWGGAPDRNMVSAMKGLPTTWGDPAFKQSIAASNALVTQRMIDAGKATDPPT